MASFVVTTSLLSLYPILFMCVIYIQVYIFFWDKYHSKPQGSLKLTIFLPTQPPERLQVWATILNSHILIHLFFWYFSHVLQNDVRFYEISTINFYLLSNINFGHTACWNYSPISLNYHEVFLYSGSEMFFDFFMENLCARFRIFIISPSPCWSHFITHWSQIQTRESLSFIGLYNFFWHNLLDILLIFSILILDNFLYRLWLRYALLTLIKYMCSFANASTGFNIILFPL